MKIQKYAAKISKVQKFPLSSLRNAKGEKFPASIPFKGETELFADWDEMDAAGKRLDKEEELNARNAQLLAKAKAASKKAAIEAAGVVIPNMENSVLLRLQNVYNNAIASGLSEVDARDIAEKATRTTWAEAEAAPVTISDDDDDADDAEDESDAK